MTITYSSDVSTSRLATFAKLLFRWRGSIYKLLWRELLLFLVLYFSLSATYRYLLSEENKEYRSKMTTSSLTQIGRRNKRDTGNLYFERLSEYCEKYTQYVPLTFILGFYVSIVFGRWWQQFTTIAWPDKLALLVSTYVHGDDEKGRMIRRTIMRYVNLTSIMGLRTNSSAILKRFPSMAHLVEAGFITEEEVLDLESVAFPFQKSWIPCQWAAGILHMARAEGRIQNDYVLLELVKEVAQFMGSVRMLTYYDWISVPLVYTQVVTLAVYTFFAASIMGRQYLDPMHHLPGKHIDLYFPFFTTSQFLFYMGWLKVAEVMINPFGEDDDDFEVNWIIERNWKISLAYVDNNFRKIPPLVKDIYWDREEFDIPHTAASFNLKAAKQKASTRTIKVHPKEAEIVVPVVAAESLKDVCSLKPDSSTGRLSSLLPRNQFSSSMLSRQASESNTSTGIGSPLSARGPRPTLNRLLLNMISKPGSLSRSRTASMTSNGQLTTRPLSGYDSMDACFSDEGDDDSNDEDDRCAIVRDLPWEHRKTSASINKTTTTGSNNRKVSDSPSQNSDVITFVSRTRLHTLDEGTDNPDSVPPSPHGKTAEENVAEQPVNPV